MAAGELSEERGVKEVVKVDIPSSPTLRRSGSGAERSSVAAEGQCGSFEVTGSMLRRLTGPTGAAARGGEVEKRYLALDHAGAAGLGLFVGRGRNEARHFHRGQPPVRVVHVDRRGRGDVLTVFAARDDVGGLALAAALGVLEFLTDPVRDRIGNERGNDDEHAPGNQHFY